MNSSDANVEWILILTKNIAFITKWLEIQTKFRF